MGKQRLTNKSFEEVDFNPSDFGWAFVAEDQIDFHDFGIVTPYDVEKILFEFLEEAYINGKNQVLVITGKGRVVRPEVEKLLNKNKYVTKFRRAGYFNGQGGAFEIWLN